jgi:poly-gamma-glutamate synthesis protein (capsule biosynthesis protein)
MLELSLDEPCIGFVIYPFIQCKTDASVRMMDEKETDTFYRCLSQLNLIISDESKLKEAHTKWMLDKTSNIIRLLQPYSSRLTKGLYNRKLLPSLLSKPKVIEVFGTVNCESHIDILRCCLWQYLKK